MPIAVALGEDCAFTGGGEFEAQYRLSCARQAVGINHLARGAGEDAHLDPREPRAIHYVRVGRMADPKENRNESASLELPAAGAFSESQIIALDSSAWKQFIEALEKPAVEIPELVELFRAKAPWD